MLKIVQMNSPFKNSPDRMLLYMLVSNAKSNTDIKLKSDINQFLTQMLDNTSDELLASEIKKQLAILNANVSPTANQLEKIKILGFPIIDERIVPKSEEILKISKINTSDVETLIEIWKREADLFTARLKINNLLKGKGIKKIYSKKLNSFAYYVDTGNKDDSTIIFTNSVMTVENLNEL